MQHCRTQHVALFDHRVESYCEMLILCGCRVKFELGQTFHATCLLFREMLYRVKHVASVCLTASRTEK